MRRPVYRDHAVVLRTYRLGEADRIVVLLTAEHGKIRAVARGVRKTGSKFGSRLEPGSHVAVLIAEGRDLDAVAQAETVDVTAALGGDLDQVTSSLALLEAVDQLALEREPVGQLYRMLVGALRTVGEQPSALIVPAFLWKVLAAEGIRPELDRCVRCEADDVTLVAFDIDQGGTLCRTCRSGAALSAAALEVMRAILGGRLRNVLAMPASAVTHEVGAHAARAFEHHVERRLRTVALFERMERPGVSSVGGSG